jgi:hypothetical protein
MRSRKIALAFALLSAARIAAGSSVSVLFVGNSLTYTNDLPGMFKKLAAESSLHVDVEVTLIAPGGAFLYDHWKHGQALALLREKHPKFLVLQGQSTEALSAPQSFSQSAQLFKAEADRIGATTILFATWARPAGDPYYKEPTSGGSPAVMQARLDAAYADVAKSTGATLAPVGAAWERAQQATAEIQLLDGTQHPSPAGTYLAAAVLFRTMFNASPVGSTYYGGLPKDVALRLQHVADEISISPAQ